MSLKDQVTLVTGASRGIGKAIALELGQAGATIIGTATTDKGAAGISEYLQASKIPGCGSVLDVNNDESINDLIKSVTDDFGSVSILVNNAGITRDNIFLRMKDNEWDEIIQTNLSSVYKLCKACIKGMIKARKGRIINISSVVGIMGNLGQSNYSAAKAGMIGFSKSLAREVGSRNVTVNVVAPGFIDTDMTRVMNDKQRESLITQIPLARLGLPQDIAKAVSFLASDAAAYVTGETLNVNGGMYMP